MSNQVSDVVTRLDVEDVVIRMFVATDERDWDAVKDSFADPFVLDMTSMIGGVPATMTPSQVADAWAEGFKRLDHVHHQVGNLQTTIDGDTALVRCYGIAVHHRAAAAGLKTRTFVGTYELKLNRAQSRWQIVELIFKLKFMDGNLQLDA
jgi:SnoaL-like domain